MNLKTVLLEITDKCNLNCTHCMNRPDCVGIETEYEKIVDLFQKFAEYNAERVFLSGGEPLLHHSIRDIIKKCADYPDINFVLTTNGLLLSEEIMTLINGFSNVTLQFSIDGVTAESFEGTRGSGTFQVFSEKMKIWDNLSLKHGLARTCLNRHNYKELPAIYQYCLQHKLYPSFIFLSSLGNGKKNWNDLELNLAQKIWCIDAINKLNLKAKLYIAPPEAPATCNFTENSGVGSLLIRADGRVAPCQYFYDDSLGNIFTDEISDILNSAWIKDHCRIAHERRQILEKSPKCLSCKIKNGCNFGCLGIANDLGDIMSYDGMCELRVFTTLCYSNRIITLNADSQKKNAVQISNEEASGA